MLADGKSLDDKRDLLVEEDLFNQFALTKGDFSPEKMAELATAHEHFNLPQILDHYRYLKSDLFGKTHHPDGRLRRENGSKPAGADRFMDSSRIRDYSDRKSQSFLVPVKELIENDWDLSINRYKEIVYEEVDYDPAEVIHEPIQKLDAKIRELNEKILI